jgi:hypothetical protein
MHVSICGVIMQEKRYWLHDQDQVWAKRYRAPVVIKDRIQHGQDGAVGR